MTVKVIAMTVIILQSVKKKNKHNTYLVLRELVYPEQWLWKFDFPTFVRKLQHVCWCWLTPNNRFVSLVKPRRGEAEKQRGSAGDVEICTTRVQLPYTRHSTPYIPEA